MGWNQFDLVASTAGSSGIAAVSRIPTSMELWWIEVDGSVNGAYWYEGSAWGQYQLAPAGSASYSNGITAVSRMPNTMEVFWIGKDGSVQDANWYQGGQWNRFELAPAGSAAPFSNIKVVSRIPNSMELWYIGPDGSVHDWYWYAGGSWATFQLAPPGSASTYSGIAAVSRMSNTMEIFFIGPDGSVQDWNWYAGGQWGTFVLAPPGTASTLSGIAVLSRIPTSMEMWFVGADGSLQDAYYYDGAAWTRFPLAPAGSARLNANITAVSRIPGSMEIWWDGADGSIQDSFWYSTGWGQFTLAPASGAISGGGIAAVSRQPNTMELWWVGANGAIQDGNWYDDITPITQNAQVLTPAGTALGGTVAFTLSSDGSYTVKFHMHDSGFPNYSFSIRAIFVAQSGMTFVVPHSGSVEGTVAGLPFGTPNRNNDDTETGINPYIADNWADVSAGKLWVTKDYSTTGVIGWVDDIAKAVLDIGAGVVGGTLGVIIGLGAEVGQLFGSLGIGETFGVIAGLVVFVGTGSLVLAVIDGVAVGAITNALIQQRPMTAAEIAFANVVFQSTIDYTKVVFTNLSGIGGRAFTFPGIDGKQYVNITKAAYDSPITYETPGSTSSYSTAGQLMIHELTHVWQIQHNSFTPGIVCQGIVNQANYVFGEDVYVYGPAGKAWSSFNLEAQGAIVDQWFAGDLTPFVPTRSAQDPNDPYFMYISGNIRANQT